MKLLATSGPCKGLGKVYAIDTVSKEVKVLKIDLPPHPNLKNGMAKYQGGILLVIGGGGQPFVLNPTSLGNSPLDDCAVYFFNPDFSVREIFIPPVEFRYEKAHSSALYKDELYITDTGHDRLVVLNLITKSWREIVIAPGMSDTKHVNSLFFHEDLMYVMCHNKGRSHINVYKNDILDKIIENAGGCSHNVWEMNGDIWFCDSNNDHAKSLTGKKFWVGPFPRGILVTDSSVFIGVSVNYKQPPTDWAGIYEFDKVTLEQKDYISLQPMKYVMEIINVD